MKKYIGCKIIKAKLMSEHTFISKIKNQDIPQNQVNGPGYLVEYPDGYKSWSPKEVFEVAYREVTDSEFDLLMGENSGIGTEG